MGQAPVRLAHAWFKGLGMTVTSWGLTTHHDQRDKSQIVHRTVHCMEQLGFRLTVALAAPVPTTG